ncbi:MAG: ATP-binding cassette domain-containing protein [Halieaceae bacterium]
MTSLIKFDAVGLSYHSARNRNSAERPWIFQDLNFELMSGETLGVIGRNGAGKSSLMRLMSGLIAPDAGSIIRNTDSILLLSIQLGFQPHLNGRENAILSGILLGMRRHEVMAAMQEIIDFAELGEQIDDPVRTYSTGMRGRLGFAVACQARPDILLIDEAMSVGDRDFRQKSRAYLLERIKSDQTAVIVSHDERLIATECNRVIWLADGGIKACGEPDEVLEQYRR